MHGIDYSQLRFFLDLAVLIGVVLNTVYTWLVNRSKATRAAIDRVDGHLSEVTRRVDRLENRADAAPSHDDLAVLHERITDLSGAVRELTGVMQQLRRAMDRVETYLLENQK